MARTGLWATLAVAVVGMAGCAVPAPPPAQMVGPSAALGKGQISTYAEVDATGAPKAVGVVFSAASLEGLPAGGDGHHCFDANRDRKIDPVKECIPGHERVVPLPSGVSSRADMPFKWAMVNWNPKGHIPPGIYDTPHFDVHFYMEPIENIFALKEGNCGPEFMDCAQFAIGRKPVPKNYMAEAYVDVGAVVPGMGNHLIDVGGPEFKGQKWQRSFIFGVYDGRVIFYEEMADRAFMLSKPNACYPIPQPEAVAVSGYYPTQSCVRYVAGQDAYTVSLEGFRMRQASAPGALRAVPPLPGKPPAKPGHGH